MLIKKCSKYIIFLLFCLIFTNCQFLQSLIFPEVVIDEPKDGLETTDSEIAVSGHYSSGVGDEINIIELQINDIVVGLKQGGIEDNVSNNSFEFPNVSIPNGNTNIVATGYSEYDQPYSAFNDDIASDEVSVFYDRIPPNIVIDNPSYNETIYSNSVTFNGSISDNDEVKSFTYIGEYGHTGNINIENGNWSVNIESLPYEFQYVTFRAKDRLDNVGINTIYFTLHDKK